MERLKFWKNKRVLVTGSTGVVGINLVNELESLEADVVAFVRDSVPAARHLARWLGEESSVTVVHGELEDSNSIMRTLAEYEIQVVYHLGAQTIVNVGNRSPLTTFKANIEGTWNLLESARILNEYEEVLESVCVASSDKAYGSSEILPYTEDMPLHGEHPYDVSKSCTDLIAQSYASTYHLPVCIARMGNIYGPGDLNFNRIIPGTIRDVYNNRQPVIRSDGSPIREYFYVGDAVDAYLTLAERMKSKDICGEAFNFSSGEKLSVLEVVKKVVSSMDSKLKPKILRQSRNEIQNQYLSIEKARKVLKWAPKYSVDQGLEMTIPWYCNEVFS